MIATVRTILLSILVLALSVGATQASELSIYNAFLNAGTTESTASANSMMVLDNGVVSMWSNPAGMISPRHEIYAGSILTSAYATESTVSSTGYKAGIGMFGYLYTFGNSAFGLGFIGRNVEESSAKYSRVAETKNAISYSEISASYARELRNGYSLGVSAGSILGRANDGVFEKESDLDTLYTPVLWFARVGVKKIYDRWRWGMSLEAPAFGTVTVEQPVLGTVRNKNKVDYSGALGLRCGLGWKNEMMGFETDILYYATNMIQVDGNDLGFDSDVISAGLSGFLRFNELATGRIGLRYRFSDPEDLTFFQLGAGGSYVLTEELTAYFAGGVLLHSGDEIINTVYDDVMPFTLRAGVIFHNLPE